MSAIDAEAIGQPGQRTFRIRVWKDDNSASLWLEKQHLQALSMALRQVMAREGLLDAQASSPPATPAFPEQPTVDLRIGRLALGRDEKSGRFVLWAHEIGSEEEAPPDFACQLDPAQVTTFCDAADAACAAGRPICPLCGGPIDPSGHLCARKNGHSKEALPPTESEEGA